MVPLIKKVFPNADMISKKQLYCQLSKVRNQRIRASDKIGMYNIKEIRTMRRTPFGRGTSFSLVNGEPKHFMYLYSDFMMDVVNDVRSDPNLHLFLDGTFK